MLLLAYFLSSFLVNPNDIKLKIARILSLLLIFLILYNGIINTYLLMLLIPLSIDKVTFFDSIKEEITLESSHSIRVLFDWTPEHISDFLKSLKDNENYIIELEFIPNYYDWDIPRMVLSKPFLINKHSSSTTISKFINERLNIMIDTFYLDDSILYKEADIRDQAYVQIRYMTFQKRMV